jgi:hypothetical protein
MTGSIEDFPDTSDGYGLYSFVNRQVARLPTPDWFASQVMQEFSGVWESPVNLHIRDHLRQFASELYQFEQYTDIPPFPADYSPHTFAAARYRDELVARVFRIGDPDSLINVLQAIATMMLTHICDLIPPPYNEEIARPDGYIPAIYKMHGINEFISFLLDFFAEEKIRESAHIFPRLRAALTANNTPASLKLRTQAAHDFSVSPVDVVSSHFKDTPLIKVFELQIPIAIPQEVKQEQARTPLDPDHPKHYCYQCKRLLPPDFTLKYWQELDFPKGPFFHTEHCKIITLNRHRAVGGDYIETYRSLMKEYVVFVRQYEQDKLAKENVMREKERIERAKMEERDHQAWLRDQERAEAAWEKQQEQLRKEEEKKAAEAVDEAAYEESIRPRPVPEAARLEHTVIVAGSGWGKTQLLQSIIAQDLQKPDPPSLIVLDSTGAMIKAIQELQIFDAGLRDRLIILDPAQSPALNMVDFSAPRFQHYSDDQREDMEAEVMRLFEYVFASKDYDLSGQMGTAFSYAVKLIMNRPNSTIEDLQILLEDRSKKWQDSPFKDDISALRHGRAFFENQFFADSLRPTRASIARRIHSLLGIGAFRRMFTASINAVDFFTEMNRGSIILVNTNVNLLKEDGMVLFGRYIIASALGAAFERADIPLEQRKTTHLIIDEAAPYFDDIFERLFTRARQFRLATTLAFQHLQQASDKMKNAIASNTRVKYAGGLGYDDRSRLAKDMETTPEFIASMKKDTNEPPQWSQFACYVRPDFSTACVQTVQFYQIENMPRMSNTAHQQILDRNKTRLSPTHKPVEVPGLHETKDSPARTDAPIVSSKPAAISAPEPRRLSMPDPGEPSSDWNP